MVNVKGIDISNNNSSVDFAPVAASGVAYVYVKATEGTTMQDNTMEDFYKRAKENDLKVGAYHFLVATSSPVTQAQNFFKKIKDFDWDLLPMLDVETMKGFTPTTLCDYVSRFINTFNDLSPLKLGIYTYTSFIENLSGVANLIKAMPLWEANYNDSPWSLGSSFFTNRIGHQYTEHGSVDGVAGDCDINVFNEGVLLSHATTPGEWILRDGKYWYRHNDGTYTKNGWEFIKDKWYFFDGDGWMMHDWKQYGNDWYLLGEANDGSMKTGWVLKDRKWYYFGDDPNDGAMRTGWQEVHNNWYYLGSDGAMVTGWFTVDGYNYLTYSTGELIMNTDIYGYHFDEKGHASKLS